MVTDVFHDVSLKSGDVKPRFIEVRDDLIRFREPVLIQDRLPFS